MSEMPEVVKRLVERFERDESYLRSNRYGEADTRKELIDPLFSALDWDLSNVSGYADAYKDVVHEYSLKIGETHKAPDYSFRIGGIRTFFVEAKRPGVDITRDPAPAYQLRRYAWTAKLPVSVLTNFRNICVYDTTRQPKQTDSPTVSRTLNIAWHELPERWGELEALISKTSVYQGSLDRYALVSSRRRGTAEVDDAFLLQMESWRKLLAEDIALRNPELSVADLNESVQQTIDRLVFLRIAEDRGIEDYGQLKALLSKSRVYERIVKLFKATDAKYNSGLFHFKPERGQLSSPDLLTPGLKIDDGVLREVVQSMYYPTSPYEFSVLSADILGQVYEQFLGKAIRLDEGHRAVIEEKPEVRRAGGVYYTPTHIVRYIVERTLEPALEGKSPRQALNVRIMDPACGSGSFLIAAYDYLLQWFIRAYSTADPKTHAKYLHTDPHGNVRLNISERKRVLTSCIFGVDIDRQAVEVTKLSLMLKVLEGESAETLNAQLPLFHVERVLPDLNGNIKVGNSLVSDDVYETLMISPEDEDGLAPFNWKSQFQEAAKAGGFHVVIGNPPYDVLEKQRGAASWPHATLHKYLPTRNDFAPALGRKLNLYRLFLIQSIGIAKNNGHFGMIVPLSIAGDISTTSTRKYMLEHLKNPLFDFFPQKDNPNRRIFKRAKLSTCVITAEVSRKDLSYHNRLTTRVFPGNNFEDEALTNELEVGDLSLVDPTVTPIPLTDEGQWQLCKRIHSQVNIQPLRTLDGNYKITRGEINQTTYRTYISKNRLWDRMLKGVEVGPFGLNPYLSQGEREWFDSGAFRRDYPRRNAPPSRRIAVQRITGVDEKRRLVAAIIEEAIYFADSTNSISETVEPGLGLEYLTALLNSDLFQWRFRLTSTNNNVGTNELQALPVRLIDLDIETDRTVYESICSLSKRLTRIKEGMLTARSAAAANSLNQQFEQGIDRLNRLVSLLYGLTEDDVRLIEARLARPSVVIGDD